ncbi:MAG TPA: DUF2520 domain-containing protein [Bacteroidales bacterium]|nr:DUF2520 domain-containing protein [Bacteroidales bacterium]
MINDIVIIGAGNAASNFAVAFRKAGKNILFVFSRNAGKARKLAEQVNAAYTDQFRELPRKADLFLIAVNDAAISEVAEHLTGTSGIVAHTSGTVDISVFNDRFDDYGVFYPLMHLSAENIIGFSEIPLCIEANHPLNLETLIELASAISHHVHHVPSEKRKILHLSAVFACNFTNLNYIIAEELLKNHDLPFEMLYPLIAETAQKIQNTSPSKLQTGPAVREDYEIIAVHKKMLGNFQPYQKIYNLLTETIIQKKKNNEL